MIAIIDYDAGNTLSVYKACTHLNNECKVTRNRDEILSASHVILPGVGSFQDAMEHLEKYDLIQVIHEVSDMNKPFLGICLGLQLLFESSEESPGVEGLSLLGGSIKRIPSDGSLKIPHIGWNSLDFPNNGRLFQKFDGNPYVYFVHSYYLDATDKNIVTATTEYGTHIEASIESGNIFACQFHPEKSGSVGLKILDNFLNL